MAQTKKQKDKQLKNKNYSKYVWINILLVVGILVSIAVGVILFVVFNKRENDNYIYYDWQRFLWIFALAAVLALAALIVVNCTTTKRFVSKYCDILCYTNINSGYYGRIQGAHAKRRAKVTIYIDFFMGKFERVVDAPKLLPMPYLHVLPDYLMYLAVASWCRNNRQGVETANTFITDNKYFHHNHKKAKVEYAVAFGVVRFTQKMMDGNYEAAVDCLRYLAIPAKKYKFLDSMVRFCKARAEHEMAIRAMATEDLQRVVTYSKAAMGKYAHVGRNTGNLNLSRQAEFYRMQLHEMLNPK